MSGHSKWASIKHKKARVDAKRGKNFTRCIKEIVVAAKAGGGDVDSNPRLRTAVSAAKAMNMPNDNIDRAIKKATGELEGVNYEEITYEGYGTGGVAILVECLTDNRNRTASDVRSTFSKYHGNLGASGCVSYLFEKRGVIIVPADASDEDTLLELTIDAGAEDISKENDFFEIITDFTSLYDVKKILDDNNIKVENAEISKDPKTKVTLSEADSEKIMKLVDALDDCDDVQNVWSNADFNEQFLEKYDG